VTTIYYKSLDHYPSPPLQPKPFSLTYLGKKAIGLSWNPKNTVLLISARVSSSTSRTKFHRFVDGDSSISDPEAWLNILDDRLFSLCLRLKGVGGGALGVLLIFLLGDDDV